MLVAVVLVLVGAQRLGRGPARRPLEGILMTYNRHDDRTPPAPTPKPLTTGKVAAGVFTGMAGCFVAPFVLGILGLFLLVALASC